MVVLLLKIKLFYCEIYFLLLCQVLRKTKTVSGIVLLLMTVTIGAVIGDNAFGECSYLTHCHCLFIILLTIFIGALSLL